MTQLSNNTEYRIYGTVYKVKLDDNGDVVSKEKIVDSGERALGHFGTPEGATNTLHEFKKLYG